ncbi:hypothetical protein F9954_15735 [Bacteroides stercoris]|nr:hypothetical protein F9954_15735 [Bacteroides stercoris]
MFFYSFVLLFFCSFILLFFYSFILLFFYSFILLFFYSFILLFFYSFILLFFYSSVSTSPPFQMSQLVHNNHPRRRLRTHARIVYIQKTCQNNHTQKPVTSRLGEVSGTSPFRPRSLSSHASPGV